MTRAGRIALAKLVALAPALLFALVVIGFALQSERFLTVSTGARILEQSAAILVVTTGMTFVLLTGGVDLSVGAIMFIGAGLAGHLALSGQPIAVCAAVMIGVGAVAGAVNALLVARLRLVAFVATLATLYVGRGLGRVITETRAMNLPDEFLAFGASRVFGIPAAVWVALTVVVAGQFVLSSTPFGRQLYAVGGNVDAARALGVRVTAVMASAYVICGVCAGVGGLVALSQLGAVSPRFGEFYEFDAITASVLGGTSLFGGRGRILPGAVMGAVLVKTIFAGLVIAQVDPYLYPMITAAIIFAAVLVDSLRQRLRVMRPTASEAMSA